MNEGQDMPVLYNVKMKKVLVTGAAGFIGFHAVKAFMQAQYSVVGLDSINDYYDVNLKYARLEELGINRADIDWGKKLRSGRFDDFQFVRLTLEDHQGMFDLFKQEGFDYVIHLAAQAGVRYSIENPRVYVQSNIEGFLNVLEACRLNSIRHLVYASSSSVYGKNTLMPFSASDNVDHPVSLYAASKKANELMAHSYSHLYGIPCTGLRFFTVYGPWGRPDMALFIFTRAMLEGRPIEVYNKGEMLRDFTYVDDIVAALLRIADMPARPNPEWQPTHPDPATSDVPYRIYNIGNSRPAKLMDFISAIEKALGVTAEKLLLPLQAGDVPATFADTKALEHDFGYKPRTPIETGIQAFVDWYRSYYPGEK
jgi:UDP-glucuronate 4-epimerase